MILAKYLTLVPFLCLTSAKVYNNVAELTTNTFDFIIVGGGLAGLVVANRLTERPDFSVLVIEAGPTHEGVLDAMVPAFAVKLWNTKYDWNYTSVPMSGLNNRTIPYARAHMLGGCSSHNGVFYTRGSADDYDRFAAVTGDSGWSWKGLLPYIFKAERWAPSFDHNTQGQFDPSVHGFDGMVSTGLPGYPTPGTDEILAVSKQLPNDFPYLVDMNAGKPLGLGWNQLTVENGARSSAATTYLSPKYAARSNLHVVLNTKVSRVLPGPGITLAFNQVELSDAYAVSFKKLTARKEVILAAGVINTPQILLNSGIGDAKELKAIGITPVLDLPSVGKNLTDHPFAEILWSVTPTFPTLDDLQRNATLQQEALDQWLKSRTGPNVNGGPNQIIWSRIAKDSPILKKFGNPSAGPNTPHLELTPSTGNGIFIGATEGHFTSMGLIIVTPQSRGSVSLNKRDPFGKPLIDFGFLTSGFDIAALKEALKLAQKFYKAPVWKDIVIEQVSPPANISDADLEAYFRNTVSSSFHGVGTAAMSSKSASYGVVNPDLLVKNAKGLRIVDASVMPFVIAGHTQAPAYAIAERAADIIKQAWRFEINN